MLVLLVANMLSLRSLLTALSLTSSLAYAAVLGRRASATALTTCLSTESVPTVLSTSANWTNYEATYNTRLQYTPAAIALPSTLQHISDAVACAATNNVPVQAKSGGHSYASYSTGGRNGCLVVDLENFQNVSVDAASGVATVGAGLRLGNLAMAIYNQGKRALAHGTCPGVGIGGHFLHGGYGYSSRAWGLALDQIVALDVVLANGSYVHASASQYPDVFYVSSLCLLSIWPFRRQAC
jgi:FAD/FMN-containing dehydrogenase